MKEQSDTPSWWRCDTHGPGTRTAWGCPECVRELRTSLATATRQLDEALALNAKWAEKAATWSASPEAAQRLQSYRDLAQQVAEAQNERDEARAALRMIADVDLYNADGMRTIARKALAATEAARKFCGVGELERAGYIPAGSADERETKP